MHPYQSHKTLILQGIQCENEHVSHGLLYKTPKGVLKILRKVHEYLPLPGKSLWYSSWKQDINQYDTFIIFDGIRGCDVVDYIHKKNPSARIIIYYVNKYREGRKNDPERYKKGPCELWSFDKNDCERVPMRHNIFCYDYVFLEEKNRKSFESKDLPDEEAYDAFFVGVDKNRLVALLELQNLLNQYGYTTNFILKKAKNKSYSNPSEQEKNFLVEEEIPYHAVIKEIQKSKCIVEIQDQGQNGLTLRTFESLFFKRKLITDNLDVMNHDFYTKENIFIVGHDEEARLKDFMDGSYKDVPEEIIQRYTWEAWLDRFFV